MFKTCGLVAPKQNRASNTYLSLSMRNEHDKEHPKRHSFAIHILLYNLYCSDDII